MTRLIYVAEPIDQAGGKGVWEQHGVARLVVDPPKGMLLFRPKTAFTAGVGTTPGPDLQEINWHALSLAEGMLAILPKGTPSIGVPIEIQYAIDQGMAVVVATDIDSWVIAEWERRPNVRVFRMLTEYEPEADYHRWLMQYEPECDLGSIPLAFARVGEGGVNPTLPARAFGNDAGLDLMATADVKIDPGEFVDVPTNLACGFPPDVWGLIVGRSSTSRKLGLTVQPGVIDPGYRGELFAQVHNPGSWPVEIQAGDRVAQLILMPSMSHLEPTWGELPEPEDGRGMAGFGSSGR